MKLTRIATCLFVLGAGVLAVAAVRPAFQSQDMPQPTKEHEHLVAIAGEWEGTLISYMPGADSKPVAAQQTTEAIGGFWTHSRFQCEFMGMPYLGSGFEGYDPAKKKFVGTWVDNMSSYLALMEGEMDAKGEKRIMRWTAPDMTGAMTPHRSETVQDANSYTSTFYMGTGEGTKSMVITMKRKAKPTAK